MNLDFKTWGISLDFYNQWAALRPAGSGKRWNWIDFTLIHLGFEHSPYKYSNELSFGLLGLNFVITVWKRHEHA